MKIAVVDDDKEIYSRLYTYLTDFLGNSAEIIPFESGESFLSVWQKDSFDIVILDIFMDKLTGMDVARKIRETDKDVKIVFSTTSNEFASESYEVNACYYLHKPFGADRVKAMLDRLDFSEMEKMRIVKLPDGTKIALRDIIYADFSSHRVTIHCKKGGDVVVRANFSEIEPILCEYPYFYSPTKGVVINFYEATAQTEDIFVMSNGENIPISRRKLKEVSGAYSSFRFELLRKEV